MTLSEFLMLPDEWQICQSCQDEYFGKIIPGISICPECYSFHEKSRDSQNLPATYHYHGYRKEKINPELRWDVWARDNFTCRSCGSRKNLTVDHIHPESKGGKATLENCQTLCKSCNSKKGTK